MSNDIPRGLVVKYPSMMVSYFDWHCRTFILWKKKEPNEKVQRVRLSQQPSEEVIELVNSFVDIMCTKFGNSFTCLRKSEKKHNMALVALEKCREVQVLIQFHKERQEINGTGLT